MSIQPGTEEIPLRVAVVGAGPAGFFAADALMKNPTPVKVDLFEALPAPYGLVRYGVAPDHQQLKKVTAKYDRTAQHEDFSYFGNVRLGQDITIEELRTWYDAVILSVGTPSHRSLGIPGEDLPGVYPAEHFINWFNGYPGCHNRDFEIDQPTAVIIGNGNVAL
ncbi:MAG: FAD-dependent oxidoreductase, partial [Verrucomicrobiota bacterium]